MESIVLGLLGEANCRNVWIKETALRKLKQIGNDKSAYRQRPPNEESGFLEK
jgi:hypothetical protein